jgi:large conductance mechanosensitive channel
MGKGVKHAKGFLKEFKDFAMRGRALDLAVGVVIGAAFSAIVTAIVNYIIMPLISILTFSSDFGDWVLEIGSAKLKYGLLLQAIINFILIAFVIFLMVKFINKIFPKKDDAPAKTETELLEEILEELKKRG